MKNFLLVKEVKLKDKETGDSWSVIEGFNFIIFATLT